MTKKEARTATREQQVSRGTNADSVIALYNALPEDERVEVAAHVIQTATLEVEAEDVDAAADEMLAAVDPIDFVANQVRAALKDDTHRFGVDLVEYKAAHTQPWHVQETIKRLLARVSVMTRDWGSEA